MRLKTVLVKVALVFIILVKHDITFDTLRLSRCCNSESDSSGYSVGGGGQGEAESVYDIDDDSDEYGDCDGVDVAIMSKVKSQNSLLSQIFHWIYFPKHSIDRFYFHVDPVGSSMTLTVLIRY